MIFDFPVFKKTNYYFVMIRLLYTEWIVLVFFLYTVTINFMYHFC
jgi:hypothetical protein